MRGYQWNPYEHYIWIEPNVKYLLRSPGAIKHAPKPWYARPPPSPVKVPPPVDKLRFVSTRRIHDAFHAYPVYTQTVADDLDSLAQTFLHALLFRGGPDVSPISHMFRSLGQEELWNLGSARDAISDTFFWMRKEQKEKEERRKRVAEGSDKPAGSQAAVRATDTDAPPTDDAQLDLSGPTGVDAMAAALYELFHVGSLRMGAENAAAESVRRVEVEAEERKTQESERADQHYEKLIEAWTQVRDAAELSERRKAAQKAEKARKKAEKAEKARTSQEEEEMRVREGDKMEVDLAEAKESESKSMSAEQPHHSRSTSQASEDDAESPPKKRARVDEKQ
ncbi:hypothetical protein C8Q80DRAFT_1271136 [Daedaleopsis nitida]|nr:hypothetical protein C8Q80DRAFT_1271136 [Daedaleopsis nitida]